MGEQFVFLGGYPMWMPAWGFLGTLLVGFWLESLAFGLWDRLHENEWDETEEEAA